jgi:hypothetical protein
MIFLIFGLDRLAHHISDLYKIIYVIKIICTSYMLRDYCIKKFDFFIFYFDNTIDGAL